MIISQPSSLFSDTDTVLDAWNWLTTGEIDLEGKTPGFADSWEFEGIIIESELLDGGKFDSYTYMEFGIL